MTPPESNIPHPRHIYRHSTSLRSQDSINFNSPNENELLVPLKGRLANEILEE